MDKAFNSATASDTMDEEDNGGVSGNMDREYDGDMSDNTADKVCDSFASIEVVINF